MASAAAQSNHSVRSALSETLNRVARVSAECERPQPVRVNDMW
jgi:hypothetical protein